LGSIAEHSVKSLMDGHICMVIPHQYFSGMAQPPVIFLFLISRPIDEGYSLFGKWSACCSVGENFSWILSNVA
jgi:hypothetical protein